MPGSKKINFQESFTNFGITYNFYNLRMQIEQLIEISKFDQFGVTNIVINIFNPYFDEFESPVTSGKFFFPPLKPIGKNTILWNLYIQKDLDEYFSETSSNDLIFSCSEFISREKICSSGFLKIFHNGIFFGLLFINKRYPASFSDEEKSIYREIQNKIGELLYQLFEYPILSKYIMHISKCEYVLLILKNKTNNHLSLPLIRDRNNFEIGNGEVSRKIFEFFNEPQNNLNMFDKIDEGEKWMDLSSILGTNNYEIFRTIQLGAENNFNGFAILGFRDQIEYKKNKDITINHLGFQLAIHLNQYHQSIDSMTKRAEIIAINEFTRKLSYQVGNLLNVIEVILKYSIALTNADFGIIQLLEGDKLVNKCFWHKDGLETQNIIDQEVTKHISLKLVKNGTQPILCNPEDSELFSPFRKNSKSIYAIGLREKDRTIGVLWLESESKDNFSNNLNDILLNIVVFIETILQRSLQYKLLEDVTTKINQFHNISLTSKEIWKLILDNTIYIIGADYGSIAMVSEDGKVIDDFVSVGYPEINHAKPHDLENDKSIIVWCAKNKVDVCCGNVKKDPDWKDKYFSAIDATISELAVPILDNGNLVCVMNFESERENTFDEDDIYLLKNIGKTFVTAIKNSDNYKRLSENNRILASLNSQLSILYEATNQIALSPLEEDPLLRLLLEKTIKITGSQYGIILNYKSGKFRLSNYVYPDVIYQDLYSMLQNKNALNNSLCEKCAEEESVIVENDISETNYRTISGLYNSSLAAFPIFQNKVVTGILVLENNPKKDFSTEIVETVKSLISLTVSAIEKAKLLKDIGNITVYIEDKTQDFLGDLISDIDKLQSNTQNLSKKQNGLVAKITNRVHDYKNTFSEFLDWKSNSSNIRFTKMNYHKTNLRNLVVKAKNVNGIFSLEKGITVITEIEDPMQCYVDPNLIGIAITNLIYNAISFSKMNSQVKISGKSDNKNVMISIKDSGPGFTEEEKPLVFQSDKGIYYKSNWGGNVRTDLKNTKDLIELHGGSITFTSEPNHGTTFYIILPKKPEGGLIL